MITWARKLAWAGAAAGSLSCGAAMLLAQAGTEHIDPGSLSALTSELHQLRTAVEEMIRTQTQTQALGVYLSVQQSRIVQAATRLDAVRKELEAVSVLRT